MSPVVQFTILLSLYFWKTGSWLERLNQTALMPLQASKRDVLYYKAEQKVWSSVTSDRNSQFIMDCQVEITQLCHCFFLLITCNNFVKRWFLVYYLVTRLYSSCRQGNICIWGHCYLSSSQVYCWLLSSDGSQEISFLHYYEFLNLNVLGWMWSSIMLKF